MEVLLEQISLITLIGHMRDFGSIFNAGSLSIIESFKSLDSIELCNSGDRGRILGRRFLASRGADKNISSG